VIPNGCGIRGGSEGQLGRDDDPSCVLVHSVHTPYCTEYVVSRLMYSSLPRADRRDRVHAETLASTRIL